MYKNRVFNRDKRLTRMNVYIRIYSRRFVARARTDCRITLFLVMTFEFAVSASAPAGHKPSRSNQFKNCSAIW